MAKRATPLYEVMIRRGESRARPARADRSEDDARSEGGLTWMSGRVLRVPAGYAW